jgi:dsRNA-specific ribonuclease
VSSGACAIPKGANHYRDHAHIFKSKVSSKEQRASVARQTGISRHIIFNEREGAQSPSVLAKAINAIIGVVFLDCGGDFNVVLRTMRHLGSVRPAFFATEY